MSRIGNTPIIIPNGITIEQNSGQIIVSGPKGKLDLVLPVGITIEIKDNQIIVSRNSEQKKVKSLHGLIRSLLFNLVQGVSVGWIKRLELVGVGYRAAVTGEKLVLSVGYSHPVEVIAPEGVSFEVKDNTKIAVSGIDKSLIGQVSANIRKVRPPEPYQGKGIRYEGERVKRKAGKAGKAGAAGAK